MRQPEQSSQVPFRLPLWSLLLTGVLVLAVVGCLAALLIALGGRTAPGGEPVLIVLTAGPHSSSNPGAAATEPVAAPDLSTSAPITVAFVLQGPTLPPPNITPTPESIAIGRTIRVIDVGDQQLNVRDRPGVLESTIVFRAPEDSRFVISEGPQQADGLTWWRIQDPASASRTGWAAANYLEVISTGQ